MKVYLIRHAQCEINALVDEAPLTKRLSRTAFNALLRGEATSPLALEGIAQTQQLAKQFAAIPLDRLYTSPLARALATASALSEVTHLIPEVMEELREPRAVLLHEGYRPLMLWQLFLRSYTRMLLVPTSPEACGLVYL